MNAIAKRAFEICVKEGWDSDNMLSWAAAVARAEKEASEPEDIQIKHMVSRFLAWKLPENFNPDGGISFKRTFNEHTPHPMEHEPSGTNLLGADQAEAMVRHMLKGLPSKDDWFASVVSFFVENGMLDQRDEYDLSDIMTALKDNYQP